MGAVVYHLMTALFGLILLLTVGYGIFIVLRFCNDYRESFQQLRRRLLQTLRS